MKDIHFLQEGNNIFNEIFLITIRMLATYGMGRGGGGRGGGAWGGIVKQSNHTYLQADIATWHQFQAGSGVPVYR